MEVLEDEGINRLQIINYFIRDCELLTLKSALLVFRSRN